MKIVFRLICMLALAQGAYFHARGEEPDGEWQRPPADGKPWKHPGTGLSFPQLLDGYKLVGEFTYENGGQFVRYENLGQRARADIFLFHTSEPLNKEEDLHRVILKEMDSVTADLQEMSNQGRYKNIQIGDLSGGYIPLWKQPRLPMATRVVTSTRIGNSKEGVKEAIVKQWVGITVVNGYIFTVRHMRPADGGQPGEDDMKTFANAVLQLIKDPALRAEVIKLVDAYLLDPFSTNSEEAAGAVLAYLKQAPALPIHIPEEPISAWMERCKVVAPGTEDHLLRAFMLGSAKAAFEDKGTDACIDAGSRQFARVYRHLIQQSPAIALPEIEQFVVAAEKDQGSAWLKQNALVKK